MARSAVGGALRGLGSALVKRSDNAREDKLRSEDRAERDALELRRQAHENAQETRREAFTGDQNRQARDHETGEREADRKAEDARAFDVVPTEEGNDRIVPRRGIGTDAGFRSRSLARTGSDDGNGMSADDSRLWNSVLEDYTTTPPRDGLTGEEAEPVVDWTSAAEEFAKSGRQDLAARAAQRASRDPETIDVGTNRRDLPNSDLRGRSQRSAPPAASSGARESGGSGTGTRENPATPTTQAEFDALPKDAIYRDPDDGQVYRKR